MKRLFEKYLGSYPVNASLLAKQSGFTFIETLLSLVIFGIISLTIAMLLRTGVDSYALVSSHKEALGNARYAVNRMTQELLALKPTDIQSISQTSFNFLDSTGVATDFHSQVVGGITKLYRGNDLLANDLNGLTFSYYDVNATPILDYNQVASVRRIKIDLSVIAENNGVVSVMGDVYPRNFYYSNFQ